MDLTFAMNFHDEMTSGENIKQEVGIRAKPEKGETCNEPKAIKRRKRPAWAL